MWEVQKKPSAVRRYRSSVVRRQAPPSANVMSPEVDVPRVAASLLEPEAAAQKDLPTSIYHWHADEPEHVDGEMPGAHVLSTTPVPAAAETVTLADGNVETVTSVPKGPTVSAIFNCEDGLSDWEFGW